MGFLGPQGFCWVSMGPNLDQSGAPWDSYGASMEHHGPLGPEGLLCVNEAPEALSRS